MLFLGVYEQLNSPDFKTLEFEGIKNEAGRNRFYLSAKKKCRHSPPEAWRQFEGETEWAT